MLDNINEILLTATIVLGVLAIALRLLLRANRIEWLKRLLAWLLEYVDVGLSALVIALVIPLTASTRRITTETLQRSDAEEAATAWADPAGWEVITVDADRVGIRIRAAGPLPAPDPADLRAALDGKGLDGVDVVVELVPQQRVELPGS